MTRQRSLLVGAGAVLLAVLVAVLVLPLRQEAPPPSASASPTVAASASGSASPAPATGSPTPAATLVNPSPGSVVSARHGFVMLGQSSFTVIAEDGRRIQEYGCGGPGRPCDEAKVAVSPDGTRVAFWVVGQGAQWDLRAFDVAAPSNVRTVATLASGLLGLRIAWSTDSQGLLYAAETEGYGGVAGGAGRSTLTAVEVGAQSAGTDAMPARTDGSFYVPLAWDRARKTFAAVLSGEGGFAPTYAVADASGFRTMPVAGGTSIVAGRVEASPDGTRVLGIDMRANVVRIWQISDATNAVDVGPGPGQTISAAHWMPDGISIAWSLTTQLGTFIPQTESSRVVYAASGGVRLIALRADGTAALLSTLSGLQLTDMKSGASTSVPLSGQLLPRGVVLP